MTNVFYGGIMIKNVKPLKQKKGRAKIFQRAKDGVSFVKIVCAIWTAEGCVKCTDVWLALLAGSMIVLLKVHSVCCECKVAPRISLFVLDRFSVEDFFLL